MELSKLFLQEAIDGADLIAEVKIMVELLQKNTVTATHELGNAIGIGDLYSVVNKNKLMYGIENRTEMHHKLLIKQMQKRLRNN